MTLSMSVGILILREVVGLTLAVHGTQKLFGWFGGNGFTRLTKGFEQQGFMPTWLWASLVIVGEAGGGLSLALGFLTPLGAAGILGAMFMATVKVHWKNGFIISKGGIEYTLVLMAASITVGLAGPGSLALDALLGISFPEPLLFGILAIASLLADGVGLLISRPAAIAQRQAASRVS